MPGAPSTAVSLIAMAHTWGTGHSETIKIKIRKTNLECPLESMQRKIDRLALVRQEAHEGELRSSMPGHKSFIANCLRVKCAASPTLD